VRHRASLTGLALTLSSLTGLANAQSPSAYPPGPPVKLSLVATAAQPIGVYARPNDARPYVIEKAGRIRALDGATWGPTLLDIHTKVSTDNERGMFAMAVDPTDAKRMFVSYAAIDGALTLSEFTIAGDAADPASERVVLRIPHANNDHYGAALVFDPSGALLVSTGDGGGVGTKGGVGDQFNNAQNRNVLLGKILRIDPRQNGSRAYQIPANNPYVTGKLQSGTATIQAAPEVWAFGLRNPWRMTLDAEGMLWVADVGQASWEEINRVPVTEAGLNFGWRLREGMHAYRGGRKLPDAVDPIFEFAHSKSRCAVIGGLKVNVEAELPKLNGQYVFGEVCSGRLAALDFSKGKPKATDLGDRTAYLTFVGSGPDGRLYATSLNGGVYRITATA
jgi:glucose/arabinose dehydrogenase